MVVKWLPLGGGRTGKKARKKVTMILIISYFFDLGTDFLHDSISINPIHCVYVCVYIHAYIYIYIYRMYKHCIIIILPIKVFKWP